MQSDVVGLKDIVLRCSMQCLVASRIHTRWRQTWCSSCTSDWSSIKQCRTSETYASMLHVNDAQSFVAAAVQMAPLSQPSDWRTRWHELKNGQISKGFFSADWIIISSSSCCLTLTNKCRGLSKSWRPIRLLEDNLLDSPKSSQHKLFFFLKTSLS